MDRIFDVGEVVRICDELKTHVTRQQEFIETMESIARDARAAVDSVPAGARVFGVGSAVSSFESIAEGIDFDTFYQRVEMCKMRAEALIPATDRMYAGETQGIKGEVENLINALTSMTDFLVSTPLNSGNFLSALQVASVDWRNTLEGINKSIDEIMMNIKGAEIITQVFSADPVNLSTGNFIYDRTDLEIGGASPFIFRRFYNSINNRKGTLGADWNHNYEVMVEDAGKEKVLILEEGKEERFLLTSTGVYVSMYQSNGGLTEDESGYRYETREQVKYFFDKEGYFLKQESLDGVIINLTYGETNPLTNRRRLLKVERDTGEFYALSYDDVGYLKSVTDHTERSVGYIMDDGRLVEISTPLGRTYRYKYTRGGKLESVENPRGITAVHNEFDNKMRTTYQEFPDGTSMSYEYNDEARTITLTERNGSKVIYVHDEKLRDIKHIYSDGEERYEYNKLNRKTLIIDKLGNKTQFAYDGKGNLTRIINALGVKTELQYSEHNQPTYLAIDGKEKMRNRYDETGNLTESIDALGNKHKISYLKQEKPENITLPDGSEIALTYDNRGNVTKIIHPSTGETTYEYDYLNRVKNTRDGNGHRTVYTYDAEGNILTVTNAEGNVQSYSYNASNKVTGIKDFNGAITKREYNNLNRLSKIIDPLGRETLLQYDAMWNLARVTEPNGAKTTFLYDEYNRLGRIKDNDGNITRYLYDKVGNRVGVVDVDGQETRFTYDALGNLLTATSSEGETYSYIYDKENRLINLTDPLGNQVELDYDANGNLVKESSFGGEVRSYTYTPLGQLGQITDEAGRTTKYHYLPGGQLKDVEYCDGTKESYTYNKGGGVRSYTDQRGYVLNYVYDSLGRVIKIKGSDGECSAYSYDSVGNVTSMTDGLENNIYYEYTLTGQLSKAIDPLGHETQYFYDSCNQLIEVRQVGGDNFGATLGIDVELTKIQEINQKDYHVIKYERDLFGRVVATEDALGQRESYLYDKKGQLIQKMDKEGYLTKYGYTSKGDVSEIQYADGKAVKMSYNPLRHLQEVEDWLGVTKIDTDPVGRATRVIYPDSKEVKYQWGVAGERKAITYPDGRQVYYGYDQHLRLSELKDGDQEVNYAYNEAGALKNKFFSNGMETSYGYNQKGQLINLTHKDREGVLDRYSYQYDILGNKMSIKKERRGLEESGNYTYSYDPMGRLNQVAKDGQLQRTYGYDVFGNRISRQEFSGESNSTTTNYAYNQLNQLMSKVDAYDTGERSNYEYSYDKRGNLTDIFKNNQLIQQYHYGALNRLESTFNHEKQLGATYHYSGLGHRVGKVEGRTLKPVLPTTNLVDLNLNPTKKIDDVVDLTKQYHNLLQRNENQNITNFAWDYNVVFAKSDGEENLSYFQDDLGSPIRLGGENGFIKESYGYDEFGEYSLKADEFSGRPFVFTGYQEDGVARTYFAQQREYDPYSGRFASEDLIKGNIFEPFTQNQYTYCWSNPLKFVDLNGLAPVCPEVYALAMGACNIEIETNRSGLFWLNVTRIAVITYGDETHRFTMDSDRRVDYFTINTAFGWDNPWIRNGETHAAYIGLHAAFVGMNPADHAGIIVFAIEDSMFYTNRYFQSGGTFGTNNQVRYMSFGGEASNTNPLNWGHTISVNNRPSDLDLDRKRSMLPLDICEEIISALFRNERFFRRNQARWNLPYAPIPTGVIGTFNSNSFAHGLLRSAGIMDIPNVNRAPGWGRPICSRFFGIQNCSCSE